MPRSYIDRDGNRFAVYHSQEMKVIYYNGCGYVVRYDAFPATDFTRTPRTMQGHAFSVGMRQGLSDSGGFAYRRYRRQDTMP